jgi:LuxR family transcriptional regulator, maltose regulon positive regulatory protein
MYTPILATKLYIPPTLPSAVPRPRLDERLDEGLRGKLTLIAAPAGFGKTTLVGGWAAGYERPVAWLSLDEGDNDPSRFLAYLVAALQTVATDIGEGVLGALRFPQPPTETVLTALLNEIVEDELVLVLDDYHVIDTRAVDDALAFLLEHLPPRMHLIIATREDPPLPLARLRARGQLSEVRAADLRFTPAEAAEFLEGAMGLDLSEEDVAALESRTEGWIAGLQLAALSMRGREDIPSFVRAFAGDNRYIVDYLVEEVLQRQPERIRSFLLQTSILDRLGGPLCDAVTGQEEGEGMLHALERGNFFVVPLDDKRHWYRYHHLFADVLYAHLMAEQPDLAYTLHWRASEWYEHNGSAAGAIRHALAAEDFERAADLVERAWPAVRRNRQEALMLAWLEALPGELLRCRPVLSVSYAHVLLAGGELDGVEDRLRDAERWLDTTATMDARPRPEDSRQVAMVVVDDEEFRRVPGQIAIARAGLALARGDVPDTVKYARRALDVAPEGDHLTRGGAAGFLGLACWTSGDLEAAHRTYADGMASLQRAGNTSDAIGGAIMLADVRITQGRLREAMSTYEHALQLASEQGDPAMRGTADMYVGMSELHLERNDLHAATQHLQRSREQGEHTGFPQNPYRWRVAMARVRKAQGDLDGALDLIDEAERLYVSDFYPDVRPVSALKTRVWVAQGRLAEARDWIRERGLSAHDDLDYLREFEHITLARVLLAEYERDRAGSSILDATVMLERLLQAAEAGGRTGRVIEILVLLALAHGARGGIPTSLVPLERAMTLAEPEGYVRTFVDEGLPMEQLLLEAAAREIVPDYTRKLLAALGAEPPGRASKSSLHAYPASHSLIEPLSERELEVLRLFGTELSGPEIANELVIALSTVRTHTKSIYRKLGVSNRRAAVRRAAELGLM